MLEMRPVYTSYEREEYTKPFGIVPEEGSVVICARYPERFVGMAYIRIEGEKGFVRRLSLVDGYEDETDLFLLGKAMLNYMERHGAKCAVYPDVTDEKAAKRLGFAPEEDGKAWTLSLVGYFTEKHGACHA